MTSPKRLARTAGVLYLLVGIFGGFAQGFVYPKIYAAGDAATTAGNLVANSGLVRIGVLADLVQATVWVFLAMALYRLLRQAHYGELTKQERGYGEVRCVPDLVSCPAALFWCSRRKRELCGAVQ